MSNRFKCQVCQLTFKQMIRLKDHMSSHHKLPFMVSYYCSKLSKKNYSIYFFKPYFCSIAKCTKTFPTILALRQHKLKAHGKRLNQRKDELLATSSELHNCICGKAFKYRSRLKSHQLRCVHIKELDEKPVIIDKTMPFKCNTCDRTFAYNNNLQRHQKAKH